MQAKQIKMQNGCVTASKDIKNTLGLLNNGSGPLVGFGGRLWAGFGRKSIANGPKYDLELPGPKARAIWDQILDLPC